MYTHYQTSGSANATTCPQKENVTTTTCQCFEVLTVRHTYIIAPPFLILVTASTKRSHLT
jgi:hypothetical protein